ncbi:MAG TPA: hypothetical protein PKD05_14535 [Candidatus Melainabacteria bacterium]|nr:hypothetical protein [Candidatus Melainabacteria bacterium]HMP52768.1 hypothetical protein [Candidatus Melainabacteria bacterium]
MTFIHPDERKGIIRQLLVMAVCLFAIWQVGRSIHSSVDRQIYLHNQQLALKAGQLQAREINKELREGLSSSQSNTGIERLARERLNLAGSEEVIIRLAK